MACKPKCPICKQSNFKVWELPSGAMLHWILNPYLAINDLIPGQRVPEKWLECQSCELVIGARSYVVCPHCAD